MNRLFAVFLLIWWRCSLAAVPDLNFSFTKLSSIESGLSQSTVNAVIRDYKGDFWIGTNQGLNHYTSHGLESYFTKRDDPLSLPHNIVYDIVEDGNRQIWISTKAGVVTYDRGSDTFRRRVDEPAQVLLDTEAGVLMGGRNYLLHYCEGEPLDTIFWKQAGGNPISSDNMVFDMVRMRNSNKILVGTRRGGIFVYDPESRKIAPFNTRDRGALLSIEMASDGCVYAGYFADGFYRFDSKGNELAHYDKTNSPLNNDFILDIAEYGGYLYLATDGGGINLMDVKRHTFSHVLHDPANEQSLPNPSITVLYIDSYHNLWAGSVRDGVFLVSNNYIKTFRGVDLGNPNGITENAVTSLLEDGDRVWIGTDGGGLNMFDATTNQFRHFPTTIGGKVISIAPWNEKELLVSAFTRGFYTVDKHSGRFRQVHFVDSEGCDVERRLGYLPRVYRVSDNEFLFVGKSVYVYDVLRKRFDRLLHDVFDGSSTVDVAYLNDDFVLLKLENKALIYAISTRRIKRLFEVPQNEVITSMSYDGGHIVWVGSSTGLGYVDLRHPMYHPLGSNHFSYVSYLHFDQYRRLWICAHNMLFSYSLLGKEFTQWNRCDGFSPNEILSNYHRHVSDRYIYLAGAQGFVKIDIEIPDPVEYESEIALDDVLVDGKSCLPHIQNNTVYVPWDYKSLEVHVNIKNKDVFQRNHLRYTVVGDNKQTFNTESQELALSGLAPGGYKIFVSNNTKRGEYIAPVHVVDIEVFPPWYDTLTFKMVIAVLLVILVLTIIFISLSYQRKTLKGNVKRYLQALLREMDSEKEVENEACDTGEGDLNREDEAFIMKLNKIIEENISNEEFGVNMLAEMMGISRASLYNKVKNVIGMGVNDYINKARIERSVYLLTHTDLSISEISYEVGFNYPRYFSTSFKHVKGITPSKFKEENRKKEAENLSVKA